MTEQGHVLAVTLEKLGDELAAAASAGATSLTVKDIADFDELGGTLSINGQIIAYTSADDDTNVVELGGTLDASAVAGDDVFIWDLNYATVVTDLVAQVQVDGDIDGDPHECSVEFKLVKDLVGGIRGLIGESVLIEEEDDDWRVIDVLGLSDPNSTGTLFKRDVMTVAATGAQTFALTYVPIPDSLHLRWEPINLDDTGWTRVGKLVTIPAPNHFDVGDVITAKYAYRAGIIVPLVLTDDFADGVIDTVSSSDGGTRLWESANATWVITAGVCYPSAVTTNRTGVLAVNTGHADGRVGALIVGAAGAAGRALGFRIDDALHSGFGVELNGRVSFDTDYTALATDTTLVTLPVTFTTGDLVEVEMNGSNFTFYKNGAVVGTASSSNNLTATKHGLLGNLASSTEGFDTFIFTEATA